MSDQKVISHFKGRYAFLSNFYPCRIETPDGYVWDRSERLYHALKCVHPGDIQLIKDAPVEDLKKTARAVLLRQDWEYIKAEVMYRVVFLKFSQNTGLKKELLNTDGYLLIEGNKWHDNFFGDCYCPKCKNILGLNMLGYTHMRVRYELRFTDTLKIL